MIGKVIRDYEVSVWTLQDSFITVLKPSGVESKGTIQNTDFNLKDDGENTFSFRIPMYIYEPTNKDGIGVFNEEINSAYNHTVSFKENPIWYNTRNGNIIASMRKVKVIFNKKTPVEKVFEFIINKVTEKHEGQEKYCEVECEGLAFNELGKQGYRISLEGYEDIRAAQDEWEKNGKVGAQPIANINYWANKVFANSNWEYEVQMDWSGHSPTWSSNKIYEDEYVSAWNVNDDMTDLLPTNVVEAKEKARLVEAGESNRYNLSQSIAEAFGVFCKYEYEYDDNYHIIGRKAIFYNNFLSEKEGIIDFIYEYNTKSLQREMDSTDLCSKMFVEQLSDTDMPSGFSSIVETDANRSLEDYLLNFDYLHGIGTITDGQYEAVKEYEAALRPVNQELVARAEELADKQEELVKKKAKLENAKDSVVNADESVDTNGQLRAKLTNDEGLIEITNQDPKIFFPLKKNDSETYFINVNGIGLVAGSLKIYKEFVLSTRALSGQILQYSLEKDEYGNIKTITNLNPADCTSNKLYATYSYDPHLYYDNVIKMYENIAARDRALSEELEPEVTALEAEIEQKQKEYDALLKNKQSIIDAFERLMGPALREGTWQPEDEYNNYGDFYSEEISTINNQTSSTGMTKFIWDEEVFDDEQLNYYEYGANRQKIYYPCIDLNGVMERFTEDWLDKLAFVYNDRYLKRDERGQIVIVGDSSNTQRYSIPYYIGSQAKLGFVKIRDSIHLALILTGASSLSDDELDFIEEMAVTAALPRVVLRDFTAVGAENEEIIINSSNINWIVSPKQAKAANAASLDVTPVSIFPRFLINSNRVKSPDTDIKLYYNGTELENYSDFSILARARKYFVTLKPEIVLASKTLNGRYTLDYTISSTPLAIYLDAIQVMKENAYPKVSYEIEPVSINKDFIYDAYNRLGQIAHINDITLMFENVMGYISELQLNLDKPWEDKVVIKNYKTKFEDLFSSIVAQTEQMKKNAYIIGMASDAFNNNGKLNDDLLADIDDRLSTGLEHVITPAEAYAQYEPFIREELKKSWEDAGEVLAAAVSSVSDVNEIMLEGADILSGFKENIAQKLTPTGFTDNSSKQRYNPKTGGTSIDFKVGDVWTRADGNVYVATENSNQVIYSSGENRLTSLKGWSLIQDGTLAQIKGAKLDIDSKAGTIDLLAQNTINIKAGRALNLAGQEVQIVGNQNVRIMGPELYLGSATTASNATDASGVHILASDLVESKTSAVDITAKGIEMRTANGIKIQSGGGIDIATSDGASTSAISISKNKGVYLGSTESVMFYSGNLNASGSNAAVKLNNSRILFGVTNGKTGNAVDITKDYMIFGSAIVNNSGEISSTDVGSKTGTAGVKITNNQIQMAVGSTSTSGARSYLSMTGDKIHLANATNEGYGALVDISKDGVVIGTASAITINESAGSNVDKITWKNNNYKNNTATFQVYAPNFVVDASGHLYAYNADIAGKIRADSGQIGGWIIDTNKLSSGSGVVGMSSTFSGTGSGNVMFWAGNKTVASAPFRVYGDGSMYATNATIKGAITATSLKIGANEADVETWINSKDYATKGYVNEADGKLVSKASLYVNGTDGLINASAYKVTESGGSYISGTGLHMDANGYLKLSSVSGTGNLAQLTMDNGYMNLSSLGGATGLDSSASSNVRIGPNNIHLATTGALTVDSGNLTVDSSGNVSVKGAITATSLTLGTGVTVPYGSISNKPDLTVYISKDGQVGSTPSSGSTGFIVSSSGLLQASNAIIYGTIYASAGDLGGWNIVGDGIRKGITIGADTYQTRISAPSDNLNLATFGVLKINSSYPNGQWQFYVNSKGDMMANTLYLRNGSIDVAGALQTLLLSTDNDQDTIETAEANGTYGMIITNYSSGNWIKVRKQDGTTVKIPFGNAARLSDARTAGARSVTVNLEDTVSMHGSGNSWTINYTLSSPYMASVSGSESVSMKYVYDDARKGYTKGTFTKISDTLYRKTGSSTYVELSYDAYKKS